MTDIDYKILYEKVFEKNKNLKDANEKLKDENEKLKKDIKNLKAKIEPQNIKSKGAQCSINGNSYEKLVHKIVKNTSINDKKFCTQKEKDLGGSTATNDIVCRFNNKDIGIEIKKYNTPDWMQCSIRYDDENKKWIPSKNCKIPKECSELFKKLINNANLFNGNVPPFFHKNITHEEWLKIKKETDIWNDIYIDIPKDTIKKMYSLKGCEYIQISDEFGLYRLGHDICGFDVPEFTIEQRLRVRTKIHSKKNSKGFCDISVTVACQPKDIKKLQKSKYSLDDIKKLPKNLTYLSDDNDF